MGLSTLTAAKTKTNSSLENAEEILLDYKNFTKPEIPYLIVRSNFKVDTAVEIDENVYLYTDFDKEESKDYYKLLQGQWTHISLTCAQNIYNMFSYDKLLQEYFLNGVTIDEKKARHLVAYYNFIRLATPKLSSKIIIEFAQIMKEEVDKKRSANIELLPKVGTIISDY